jgi:hypothetical protein
MAGVQPRAAPVRQSLRGNSLLRSYVHAGLGALANGDRTRIAQDIRPQFADSLDLDSALRARYPTQNRWDYLLGHETSGQVIGLETHSARSDQISTVIEKRRMAREQLSLHFKPGAKVHKWLWVSSGRAHFADTEKTRRRLDQHGIQFVGSQVLAKHLIP